MAVNSTGSLSKKNVPGKIFSDTLKCLSIGSKSNKKVPTEVVSEQIVTCLKESRAERSRDKLQDSFQELTKSNLDKIRFRGLLPSPVCGTSFLIKKVVSQVGVLDDKNKKPTNKILTHKKVANKILTHKKVTNKKPTNKKPTNKILAHKKVTNKILTNKKVTNKKVTTIKKKKIQKKKDTLKMKSKKGGGDCVPLDSWNRCAESRKSPLNGIQRIYNGQKTIFTPKTGSPVNSRLELYTIF